MNTGQKQNDMYHSKMTIKSSNPIYIRFLNLTQAIAGGEVEVDLLALRLLEAAAVADNNKAPLTVTQAMGLNDIASPATMHRKLNDLLDAGFIKLEFEGKDRRTKYLIPTVAAGKYFDRLGKALVLANHAP